MRMSAVAWWTIQVLNRPKFPVSTSVLNMIRPQNVIQSMFQIPVRPPYRYDFNILERGACQMKTATGTVTTPARIVASHAVTRKTASIRINAARGISATRMVSHRCPVGLRVCSNIRTLYLIFESYLSTEIYWRETSVGRARKSEPQTHPRDAEKTAEKD